MSSDEDESVYLDDGPVFRERSGAALGGTDALNARPQSISAEYSQSQKVTFDSAWVESLHQTILEQVRKEGIVACKWGNVLERWKDFLAEAPFEDVEFGCIRLILQYARLTAVATPTFYETLRKLGRDILCVETEDESVRKELLGRLLKPETNDTDYFSHYFGPSEKVIEDPRSIANHLDKLHALYGSTLSQELQKEAILGFVVPHIRSNRYHPVELAAIVRHLVRGIPDDVSLPLIHLAEALEAENCAAERSSEAQSFILRCFENMYRARQSLEGAEKRSAAVGVIVFGDVSSNLENGDMERSALDKWHDENVEKSYTALERCTLKQLREMIRLEQEQWEKWEPKLKIRKGADFKVAKQPLFNSLGRDKLSSSSLLSQATNSIKAYAEKKKNLRELAEKSSRKACVTQAIKDCKSDLPDPSPDAPRGGRHVAVFGYTRNHDGRGVPEAAEQSVTVRSVALTRKYTGDDGGPSEELDARVFEIGVSLAGSYLRFSPRDSDELHDMLRTSGLGLSKEDTVEFFLFVPLGQHSPRSKQIHDLLQPAADDRCSYSHVLLAIPDNPGRQSALDYAEIADAGGRFLVDLKRVGCCKTEGMRYHPLAVEAAASVAVSEDGKRRAFRRLAVLLPPSLPNEMPNGYKLGRLGVEAARGSGFQESAEIIAEVLSLMAIDKSKMDNSADSAKYRKLIKNHLEGNPLLLYYTSIELLNTLDLTFAKIITEYWNEKLGLGNSNYAASLSKDEQESRKIVLSLITSGAPRGGGSSSSRGESSLHPNAGAAELIPSHSGRQSVACGEVFLPPSGDSMVAAKRIALATEAHLRLLPSIIRSETRFAQEEIFVEESNFESVLLRLKRASPTSLTFIFVYITGRVSAGQIDQLVSVPASAIKLIFQSSQSLANLLDLTPSIRDIIHRPESIKTALADKMHVVSYSDKSAVGAVVMNNTKLLTDIPDLICKRGFFWDDQYPEEFVRQAVKWKDDILEWVKGSFDEEAGPEELLRILVTPDHTRTSKLLESSLRDSVIVRVVDAGDRSKFDELKSFVDCRTSLAFSYSNVKNTATIANRPKHGEAGECSQRTSEVFILIRASFLPHSRLEVLVSRCCEKRARLILLLSEPTSVLSRFRVCKDATSPPIWVRVPTVTQREFRHDLTDRTFLAFTGLQLIFSQEAVVTEDHLKNVEKFLEAPSQDSCYLDFLDNVEALSSDRNLRAPLVRALSNLDDVGKFCADEALPNKCTLAEILAWHINRYLRFPACTPVTAISFSDFCRQPRARLLSQVHRIEGYLCYIFSKTEDSKRLTTTSNPDWPLGFPLGGCFAGLKKNIHAASNPGLLLGAVFERELSQREQIKFGLACPQYIDPGRGDVVTHMQEIDERRAIVGEELHWEDMFMKWESGPEITDDILDHILIHSPSRISVLLSMTPPQIVNLSLSAEALKAVARDFDNCETSLRQLPADGCQTLRTRAAAVSWLLLTKGSGSSRLSEKNFAEDQTLLLDSGIYIEADAEPTKPDSGGATLLIRVASAMIPLDTCDTLTSQHAVRDFLLSNSNAAVVGNILDNPDVKIGQAFINALVQRETLNAVLARSLGMAVCDRLGNILKWVKEPKSANVEDIRKEMTVFAGKITPSAIACLLMNANPPADLAIARDGILLPCIALAEQLQGIEGARSFLDQVLKPLCDDRWRGLAVELFNVLTRPASQGQIEFPLPRLQGVAASWNDMYLAMRDPAHTEELLKGAEAERFSLPFEVSERLCELYVNFFCADGWDVLRDIDRHAVLLQSDLSRDAIYKYMTSDVNGGREINHSVLGLLWFTWWSKPWLSFPLQYLPNRETWHIFQSVTRRISVTEEKTMQGLSTIARFAIAPHTLPASTANALKLAMVSDEPIVKSEKYVLAQFRSPTYPVYGFRTHQRFLPRECIDCIVREMIQRSLPGFPHDDSKEKLRRLFPITDSGVSTDIVERNLNILVHIHQSPPSIDQEKTAEMRAQIFLPTLAWFYAAGIGMNDLKSMLGVCEKDDLARNYTAMVNTWRNPDFPTAMVFCPLPVYVEVRFVCGKVGKLFHCNAENASVTVQWLAMLGLQYSLDNYTAPQQFQHFAEDRSHGRYCDPDIPKEIVRQTMKEIAGVITRRHKDVALEDPCVGRYHVVFVLDESGSMKGTPWKGLVAAVRDFLDVRRLVGAEDEISLITFNGDAKIVCERNPLESCVRELESLLILRGGGTLFAPALKAAHDVLVRGPAAQEFQPVLLFMSDGGSIDGDAEMQAIARIPDIQVRTFAFGSDADVRKLQGLATIAGGKFAAARDGNAIRKRFTDMAAGLAKSNSPGGDEKQKRSLESQQRALACSAVIEDCVPLADFFAQLRVVAGSQSFAKFAFEGLSAGLKDAGASKDLQVCVADALYMLIGVTPVNSGVEVMLMLESWREKELTVGSSIVMEIQYMATNVYEERGLGDLAKKLLDQIQAKNPLLKRAPYVRNPASTPLSTVIKEPGEDRGNLYSYIGCPLVTCPGRERPKPQAEHMVTTPRSRTNVRTADFDHERTPRPSHRSRSNALAEVKSPEDLPPLDEVQESPLFKSASDACGAGGNKGFLHGRYMCRGLAVKPRTISARDLVHMDTGPSNDFCSGYAVIRIVPGLHPVLRCPGDSQNIPVSQQTSLGRSRDSFDREDHMHVGSRLKMEAIFSNNGGTWDSLNQLPAGSTIMGKGFYLRKTHEGWVLLMGATSEATLEHPPYVLWSVLDTMKLAAIDFADLVVDTLRAAAALAYKPTDTKGRLDDSAFAEMLREIRSWHMAARGHDKKEYLAYLHREFFVCKHLLNVMNSIHTDTRGATLVHAFDGDSLERTLQVPVRGAEHGIGQIISFLCQFIGIRDCALRSQLIFTLELVLANYNAHLKDLNPPPDPRRPESEEAESESVEEQEDEEMRASAAFMDLDREREARREQEFEGKGMREGDTFMAPNGERKVRHETNLIGEGLSFPKNKLIAAHEHITQYKFHQQSLQIVCDIERGKAFRNLIDWTRKFCDSDDEEEDVTLQQQQDSRSKSEDDSIVNDAHRERGIAAQQASTNHYVDDELDMPGRIGSHQSRKGAAEGQDRKVNPLFPQEWGYGYEICSRFCVQNVYGDNVPLYFVQIDGHRLKMAYSDADGLPIAYVFHKRLLDKSLKNFKAGEERKLQKDQDFSVKGSVNQPASSPDDCKRVDTKTSPEDAMLAYRGELLCWLTDLIRSPLPTSAKDWFLDKLEHGPTTRCVPSLSVHHSDEDFGGDLNLVVIAHCIATALPTPNEFRNLFRTAFHVPREFLPFCKRKNDLYGVHIVRGGTLQELQDHGAVVEVCSLGYDALTRSKDNASMYLSIIDHFSAFTWLVYVTGLDHIDDSLLKWLAEYTKAHPWRFVYLENTQTSWNFSENRDRCIYDRAPPPFERDIRTKEDLKNPEVARLRPTHEQAYPRVKPHCDKLNTQEQKLLGKCDWPFLSTFTWSFFRNSAANSLSNEGIGEAGEGWATVGNHEHQDDYRRNLRAIFGRNDPCIVLLCSPPGAGKSHFSNELAEMEKRKHQKGRAFIDGSDDRLVDMALTEILNVELPNPSKAQFLIVDEFHMLKEQHKQDLFHWLEVHARRLHVLLIANRKDANDEKLLEDLKQKSSGIGVSSDRICHFTTRLGNTLLSEVMEKRKTDPKRQLQIRRWMHCCRCLFGGEAVSLRGIASLEEQLKSIDARTASEEELINLLLDKVPTVSKVTARDFVFAFLACCEDGTDRDPIALVSSRVKGPVSLMVQAALLTEQDDQMGMDFPDFVSFGLERAYDAPPALRIAAWCCQMQHHAGDRLRNRTEHMDSPTMIFQSLLVDQCGFPLQLEEQGFPKLSEGLAFSWGGDYSQMQDIINAVKHGHSVDWSDVQERCWKYEPVQDSRLLVELLSVCTSPSKVLGALTKDNLCALLKKSSPGDSLNIAVDVLKHQSHLATAKTDKFMSPYRTAVWMVVCYETTLYEPADLLNRIGLPATEGASDASSAGATGLDWRETELADALIWASTHMQDMVTCRNDDDLRSRTAFLISTLVYLGQKLIAANDHSRAARLWGGMFSPLLRVTREAGGGRSRKADILVHLAMHADDANSRWRDPLQALWAIAHGKGTAAQVADVWDKHGELLLVGDARSSVHPRLAAGVLCVAGVIPSGLQTALLTRGGDVDLGLLGDNLERALGLLHGAIESLAKDNVQHISLAAGLFRDLVLKEAHKFLDEDA